MFYVDYIDVSLAKSIDYTIKILLRFFNSHVAYAKEGHLSLLGIMGLFSVFISLKQMFQKHLCSSEIMGLISIILFFCSL